MTEKLVAAFQILLNGKPLDQPLTAAVLGLRIVDPLGAPSRCQLQLSDLDHRLGNDGPFTIGAALSIRLGHSSKLNETFSGEIVELETNLDVNEPTRAIVQARDRQHRLRRGTHTRTFRDVKDSDVAVQIAREQGLSADVDDSGVVHTFLLQSNRTDHAFLSARAAQCGFHLWVDGTTLFFKRPNHAADPIVRLIWGESLARLWQEENLFGGKTSITAHGRIQGNPAVAAGTVVEIAQANPRVDGTYTVTEATHIFDADSGYATEFSGFRSTMR